MEPDPVLVCWIENLNFIILRKSFVSGREAAPCEDKSHKASSNYNTYQEDPYNNEDPYNTNTNYYDPYYGYNYGGKYFMTR